MRTVVESAFAHDPDPQKHRDNLRLYYDLTTILAESGLVGFSVALDLRSYREDPHVQLDGRVTRQIGSL